MRGQSGLNVPQKWRHSCLKFCAHGQGVGGWTSPAGWGGKELPIREGYYLLRGELPLVTINRSGV